MIVTSRLKIILCINALPTNLAACFEYAQSNGINTTITLSAFNKFYAVRFSVNFLLNTFCCISVS